MEYLTKDIELGKDEVVVWDKDHIAKFIMNTKTRQTRPVAKISYWDIHSPVNVEKVTLQPAKGQPQQSLIDAEVLKDAGVQLLTIAKALQVKEGISLSAAIEKACRNNPGLYETYTNKVRR